MDAALELEDDVFFADLSRQISLLIMDDDEDSRPSVNLQAFSQAIHPATQASYFSYENQRACTRESKGTGVFIPQSPHPRRKNVKQGRITPPGNKFQRPSDQNLRGIPTHMAYNNNISPAYHHPVNQRTF